MQTLFSAKPLKYDGTLLRSHFAYRNFALLGDSCVAFVGPCEVKLDAMLDLEDVQRQAPIFSQNMLHFIFESFSLDLKATAAFQRLMVAIVKDLLSAFKIAELRRQGDDLYVADRKLSVSIATPSPVSSLIHLGLNVVGEGAPVAAIGLADLGLDTVVFAKACLTAFKEEYLGMLRATYKVRGVE